jgi:hypothetical protein
MDLNVVSQALFGVLDLEREGQVPQEPWPNRIKSWYFLWFQGEFTMI